ncbi:MAG TPA: hypothetical protein VL688_06415 [Verrucomicrobiae bacterium]|jgi:methyl-accepting chemotaxis protein|nr:hypothetical protein [Verrucomicrobiae bacterium]
MDKKTLYEKAEHAFNQAFEAAKQSVKVVSEKAGEAAQVTKLLIEKAALEHRVTKKFAQIGSSVYEQSTREGRIDAGNERVKALIEETKKLDAELARVEAALEQEKIFKKENRV